MLGNPAALTQKPDLEGQIQEAIREDFLEEEEPTLEARRICMGEVLTSDPSLGLSLGGGGGSVVPPSQGHHLGPHLLILSSEGAGLPFGEGA